MSSHKVKIYLLKDREPRRRVTIAELTQDQTWNVYKDMLFGQARGGSFGSFEQSQVNVVHQQLFLDEIYSYLASKNVIGGVDLGV